MEILNLKDFEEWLKSKFSNLHEAKEFYKSWIFELEQETPFGVFSFKAMAKHISTILEHKPINKEMISYYETQFGTEIYNSQWD